MSTGARVTIMNNTPRGVRPSTKIGTVARVRLKLYALAYVESRHGIDASPAMCWDALVLLCSSAIAYGAALENKPEKMIELVDRTIREDRGPANARTMTGDRVARARTELKLAAMGYESSRRGADAFLQGVQPELAINMLCQAAIMYYEALDGPHSDKSHLINMLGLDEG